jgi:hypothetical protein
MNDLITALARILVTLFFIGMVGSALVVLVTIVGDLGQVFKDDKTSEKSDL